MVYRYVCNGFLRQIRLESYQPALPVPRILVLCNHLQNVVATTYIFRLQLSTFIFYNKHSFMEVDGKIVFFNEAEAVSDLEDSYTEEELSDGTLWEGQIALYFRWTCLPDCAVPELDADYRRNNRRLS